MTRTARRSQKKSSLPATPWSILKRKFSSRYRTLEEEYDPDSGSASEAASTSADTMDDSDSSAEHGTPTCSPAFVRSKIKRKEAENDLKETRKSKLTGNAAKRFFQKIKQKFTTRKLRRNLKKVEVSPLLREESCSGSDGSGPVLDLKQRKKKSKKSKSKFATTKKSRLVFQEGNDTKLLLGEEDQSDNESSRCSGQEQEGAGFEEEEEEEIDTNVGIVRTRNLAHRNRMEVDVVSEKKKKQSEARRLRRQKKKVCFNCRQSGHLLSECPMPQASGTGVCFKCGSANHTSKNCKAKVAEGQYPYAKCFICQEIGHLSSACPDNPNGLYPHGGCCKVCGSVEHLKSNCPQRVKDQRTYEPWDSTSLVMTNQRSLDAEEFEVEMETNPSSSSTTSAQTTVSNRGLATYNHGSAYRPRPKVVHF